MIILVYLHHTILSLKLFLSDLCDQDIFNYTNHLKTLLILRIKFFNSTIIWTRLFVEIFNFSYHIIWKECMIEWDKGGTLI
jgi:hypothetical protein